MSAVTLRADGDSTPGSDGGERITRLFPKCRPRAAMAANTHDRLNSGLDGRDFNKVANLSSDDEHHGDMSDSNQVVVLNTKAGTYKLRDSRIIEIAGGRELYSQSRTKAMRKLRHSTNAHKHNLRNKSRTVKDGSEYNSTDNYNGETIVQRIVNNDNLSRTMISKQTSPSIEDRKTSHIEKNCILPRDTPPPLEMTNSVDSQTQKGSPIAVVADGEVVVFDDISDDWKVILNSVSLGLRLDLDTSDNDLDVGIKRTIENVKNGCNSTGKGLGAEGNYEGSSGSTPSQEEERASDGSAGGAWASGDDERNRVTRVIGELPIAEYEGSPRRYGIGQVPHSRSPRPGFPQRVITDSGDNSPQHSSAAFDYLYEFSETRKVLEEFFRCPTTGQVTSTVPDDLANFQDLEYELRRQQQDCGSERGCNTSQECSGRGGEQRRARPPQTRIVEQDSPRALHNHTNFLGLQESDAYEPEVNLVELSVGTDSSGSGSQGRTGNTNGAEQGAASQNLHFTLSPETTDCDSNCGDLDSEVSLMLMENDLAECNRMPGSMPVLEDGLSSGHASDTDNNNALNGSLTSHNATTDQVVENGTSHDVHMLTNADLHSLDPLASCDMTPPPPAPAPHRVPAEEAAEGTAAGEITAALQDLRTALRAARAEPAPPPRTPTPPPQVWVPSKYPTENASTCRKRPTSAESTESVDRKPTSGDEDEADTDLETDRLLGQQRTDDQGFFDDKGWRKPKSRTVMPSGASSSSAQSGRVQPVPSPAAVVPTSLSSDVPLSPASPDDSKLSAKEKDGKKKGKNKEGIHMWNTSRRPSAAVLIEGVLFRARYLGSTQLVCEGQPTKATRMLQAEEAVSRIKETVQATNRHTLSWSAYDGVYRAEEAGGAAVAPGTVFRLSFLGSVELDEDGGGRRRKKRLKKTMVEEAVTKIKAPEGENQPSTEVDLFISTEKIMVLNTELKEIMMDHALRTISYIADIGDLVVLMARRRFVPHETDSDPPKLNRTPKMICHVFESEEAQFIAQSIGQAFQVAYMEFLKANGIEDHSFVKEMDYQEVLNSQEIFGDELQMFAKKELQKEVVVPKTKGEILGVVVVESGWGSMLPTVVIANLAPAGAAARCGQLNIGDQIIAINGVSLVGLPLSTCQTYIKNSKNQTVVKLTVVPCPPVVEVKIKRPDTKYQLGFSVQNGVICSLLRGGIAERGGVRVGHRIIEINSQSVVAVPHERIVNLLATSVGEILMKTMPTSMFRLLTGQENPIYI